MLRRIDLRGRSLTSAELAGVLPRAALDVEEAVTRVRPLIEDVRARGGAALRDAAQRFDGVRPTHLRVPPQEIEKALGVLEP